MDKYELLLKDLKQILEFVPEISFVSFGKLPDINIEDKFTSVYISPEIDEFELQRAGNGISAYTNSFFIRLTIHMDCSGDDLKWVSTRRLIIDAILNDDALWNNIVDRDIISIAHDDFENHPRKTMAMLFFFTIREDCIV